VPLADDPLIAIDDAQVPLASSPFGPRTGGGNAFALLMALGLAGAVVTGSKIFRNK